MILHLIRHAKTEVRSTSGKDFDRSLMLKGVVQSNMLGTYLHDHNKKFNLTFCSDAIRTRQTLEILSSFMDLGKVNLEHNLYLADREFLLQMLWSMKHKKDVLIIGHNDGLSELASYLTDSFIDLKTCGYIALKFDANNWQETSHGTGIIVDQYRPQAYLLS